ncbi:MAG: YbaK/EbsC family protein [gamma proteobacterium symbiont of Phacoides pectinatus]
MVMAIAKRLLSYLREKEVGYLLLPHPRSGSSMETAERAHVPGDALAKGVLVRDGERYTLVVVPSDYHIELERLRMLLGRDVDMASEPELEAFFSDCERGAVPPIGPAYGVETLWDPETSLGREPQVYFEAGDHEHLVCVTGEQFHELLSPAVRGRFSHHI